MSTTEPTLAAIPGILVRTVLRLVARVFLLTGGMLVLLSIVLVTWRSARTPRQQKWIALGVALMAVLAEEGRLRQNASD